MQVEIEIAVHGAPPAVELALRQVIDDAIRQFVEGSGGTVHSQVVDAETGQQIGADLSKLS